VSLVLKVVMQNSWDVVDVILLHLSIRDRVVSRTDPEVLGKRRNSVLLML
jgi:hypothetical protein